MPPMLRRPTGTGPSRSGRPSRFFHTSYFFLFFWEALLLIRITQNGRRPTPYGAHRNWTYLMPHTWPGLTGRDLTSESVVDADNATRARARGGHVRASLLLWLLFLRAGIELKFLGGSCSSAYCPCQPMLWLKSTCNGARSRHAHTRAHACTRSDMQQIADEGKSLVCGHDSFFWKALLLIRCSLEGTFIDHNNPKRHTAGPLIGAHRSWTC